MRTAIPTSPTSSNPGGRSNGRGPTPCWRRRTPPSYPPSLPTRATTSGSKPGWASHSSRSADASFLPNLPTQAAGIRTGLLAFCAIRSTGIEAPCEGPLTGRFDRGRTIYLGLGEAAYSEQNEEKHHNSKSRHICSNHLRLLLRGDRLIFQQFSKRAIRHSASLSA